MTVHQNAKMLNDESKESNVINELLLCPYNPGIIGFKASRLTPYKWLSRDSNPVTKNEIKRVSSMKIHKMHHSALDIRINTNALFVKASVPLEDD